MTILFHRNPFGIK